MRPTAWIKHPKLICTSSINVFGPGQQSFTKSRDDKEDWIIYHSARYSGADWNRQIRGQKFTWNADSTPNLGEPGDRNIRIQIRSGDPIRDRYEAAHACLIKNPRTRPDDTASNQIKVSYIDYRNSTVIFTIQCSKEGTYIIVIRDGNGTEGGPLASHWLSINNGSQIGIPVVCSRWDM
jgi:hypothetical protein